MIFGEGSSTGGVLQEATKRIELKRKRRFFIMNNLAPTKVEKNVDLALQTFYLTFLSKKFVSGKTDGVQGPEVL